MEQAYARVLRVLAFYAPRTHDLATLRRLAEPLAPQLIDLWRASEARPEIFATLQAAYGHRRAARTWPLTDDALEEMLARAAAVAGAVETVCVDAITAVETLASAEFDDDERPEVWRA